MDDNNEEKKEWFENLPESATIDDDWVEIAEHSRKQWATENNY